MPRRLSPYPGLQRQALRRLPCLLACFAATIPCLPALGQISLSTAVNLTLKNSPKVKLAQADVTRAQAVQAQSRDAFVPAISATGGVGKSTGAPLDPPVVFSVAAQSLVFNSSQLDYIRAARAGVQSAQLALDAVQSDVVEDVTNAYVALDSALGRRAVQTEALDFAHRLVRISEERFAAGVDPHSELTKARHTEAQIQLQQLLIEDEVANNADHLGRLTGLGARGLTTDHASIPSLQVPPPSEPEGPNDPNGILGISAAFAAARAKQYTAHGEKRYLLRPQVAFSANYSRISTAFTSYTQYYPGFGAANNSFNSLSLGIGVTLPILDLARRARAHEAEADAAHSLYDAQVQQMQFLEARSKLRHSAAELAARKHLAELDRDLAQDQLDTVLIRLQASAGAVQGEQLTPKDEGNARLQERLRTLDLLAAELQLRQAEVSFMRQEGTLAKWLTAVPPSVAAPGTAISPASPVPVPSTVGIAPNGAAPAGAPAAVPTVGTTPATLPTSPVTTPAPGSPTPAPSTPSGTPHP